MRLHSFLLKDFRRLKDVYIDLDKEVSIFVGANNSGKTSATHALQMFLAGSSETRFSIHDFSSDCWQTFDRIGNESPGPSAPAGLPKMTLDLWFEVNEADLGRVMSLLPRLDWVGTKSSGLEYTTSELLLMVREATT